VNSGIYKSEKACRVLSSICLLCIFILPVYPCHSGEYAEYVQKLINIAAERRLYDEHYWNVLLHYKPKVGERKSLIDDPTFFLSPVGKRDPKAELIATIQAFFTPQSCNGKHPQCQFPARLAWLKQALPINENKLPHPDCPGLESNLMKVDPDTAVLIYASASNTRLASMFGHTFLRIDNPKRSNLISPAVNYSALTRDKSGFGYAYRGIFGHYKGYYSMLPYYQKLKEYDNLEDRDIWEYHLNLNAEEVKRMMLHIWELKEIYSDYYFFQENCSFNLLYLIESARPSLHLVEKFWGRPRFWVIPSDTVVIINEAGIVSKVIYRPCLANKIQQISNSIEKNVRDTAMAVLRQELPLTSVLSKADSHDDTGAALDLSAECLQYQYSNMELDQEQYRERLLHVLNAKSDLKKVSSHNHKTHPLSSPHEGHRPARIAVGIGHREDLFFTELNFRPAYHDLFDPEEGYVPGSQLNLFEITTRYYETTDSLVLDRFRLIDILALAPRELCLKPISWKANTGFDMEIMPDGSDHLLYRLNTGAGVAYRNQKIGFLYGMLETDLELTDEFQDSFAFGAGFSLGIKGYLNDSWTINVQGQVLEYFLGDSHRSYRGIISQHLTVAPNIAVSMSFSSEKIFDFYEREICFNIHYYF